MSKVKTNPTNSNPRGNKVKGKKAGAQTTPVATTPATPTTFTPPTPCPYEHEALKFDLSRTGPNRGGLGQLAQAIGKSETMLSLVLSGKKLPPILMMVKMADVLTRETGKHVTVDQILRSGKIAERIRQELRRTV